MIRVSVPNDFLTEITMRRYAQGSYVDGAWIDGATTDTLIRASIQPLSAGEYRLLPEGNSGKKTWKLFWNGKFMLGVDNQTRPDEVIIDGVQFKLSNVNGWEKNGYSEALFVEI